MKSQYILIFIILIFSLFFQYLYNLRKNYIYVSDIDSYLAEDFRVKIRVFDNKDIINVTYFKLCLEYERYCYYNTTHIIVYSNNKQIILPVED